MVKALDGVIMIEFYFRLSMSNKDTLKSLLLQANEENGIKKKTTLKGRTSHIAVSSKNAYCLASCPSCSWELH